ncbi:hypothetical protein ACQ5TV_05390 [Acetobacter ghanensis]|uniref:hypothetical protein n=1 Tax=Acetobacter ghanensis TaxID=431306 RepID=UPI003D3372AC
MADVYRVGVAIGMTDNATQVLQTLSRSILGVNMQAEKLEGGLNRAKVAAIGLTGVVAGGAAISGMMKLVGAGKEFVHQQSLMMQAGLSHQEIAKGTAAAWAAASSVIGSSAEKNIALVADLRDRLGSMDEAVIALNPMAKVGVVLQNLTGVDQERAADTAMRFLEMRGGLVDPVTHELSTQRVEQGGRLIEAIALGTRGKVAQDQLLMFQTYARAAGAQLSDRGLINMAPVIAASKNPSTVGTQLSSLQQQILGGVTTSAGAQFLERLGVLDSRRVHEGRGGHLTFDAGALVNSKLAGEDPVEYINRYVVAGLQKMGAFTSGEQTQALLGSHLRSTVIGLLTEVVRSYPAFRKDADNIARAAGVDQYQVAQATDPTTKLNNFETAWHNLMTALGAPIVNDATGMISKLTGVITTLTDTARKHPRAVADIELGIAGIAGLVALSGSIAVVGAALGPLASGLGALTGVLAGGEVASAVAAAGVLGGGVAIGGSLLGVAAGITALGAAALSLPPAMKWLIDHFGVSNPHPGINARGLSYDHAAAQPKGAPTGGDDWWASIKAAWNAPAPLHANARGLQGHAVQHPAHGNLGPDSYRPIQVTTQVMLDRRVLAEAVTMHAQEQARQDMRASGTAPDLMQYAQYPGRSVGQ